MSNGYLRAQIMAENTVGHFTRLFLNFERWTAKLAKLCRNVT